jgi:hypothetical protein
MEVTIAVTSTRNELKMRKTLTIRKTLVSRNSRKSRMSLSFGSGRKVAWSTYGLSDEWLMPWSW